MAVNQAILEIDADVDGDGNPETGVFVMSGNISVQETVRPAYAIESFGGGAISTAQRTLNDAGLSLGPVKRRGITVDTGAGTHSFEIDFIGWEGSSLQWGLDDGSDYDATGENAINQIQVFQRFLQAGTTDSISPARLFFGEYNDVSEQTITSLGTDGKWVDESPIPVQIDFQRGTVTAEETDAQFNGSITCTQIFDIGDALDAVTRQEY